MTKFRRLALAFSAGLCTALFIAGCEDGAAKARAQVQRDLEDATNAFHTTVMASAGTIEDAKRAELRSLLNTLNGAATNANAGPGQKAAAASLAADVSRVLADAQLSTIGETRAQNRLQRVSINGKVSAAERLQVIATALETSDVEAQLAKLKDARTQAEEALRGEQSQVATLAQPLSQLQSKIDEARQQVNGLREQENSLRHEASELGYAKGFKTYEQAISVRRQADVIETSSSYDELSRDFDLAPNVSSHEQRVDQIESLIASIDQATAELHENADSTSALAANVRKDLNTLTQEMGSEVVALTESVNGLKPAIDEAAKDLESAATRANTAAGANPAGGNSARLTAASADVALGQLHESWARELEQRAALLSHLSNSSLPGLSGKYSAQVDEANAGKEEAVQAAVSAYNDAIDMYSRVTGPGASDIAALQHDVEVSVAALTGQAAPEAPVTDPSSDGAGMSSDAPIATGSTDKGAESPEALAAAIAAMTTPEAAMQATRYQIPLDRVNFSSPAERQLAMAATSMTDATGEFLAAVKDKFGSSADQILKPMLTGAESAMPKVSGATVTSVDGDHAEISIATDKGTQAVGATMIDGRWYLGTPDNFSGGLGANFNQVAGDAQQIQQQTQFMQKMANAMSDFAKRTRAGEFANPQALMMAFGQEMQANMPSGVPHQ